ncbi:MAG: hypothetical protein QOE65_506 [Solirubrobacteraceae bacterium]|nr:hypothetical protein [Solirubrobacteraceae bacterium]
MSSIEAGTLAGIGSFRCEECGFVMTLANDDALPRCPGCGGTDFARASLFGASQFHGRPWSEEEMGDPAWLEEVRDGLDGPGDYLAYERAGETRLFALSSQWTRVGRSLAADIRFDDPTVSRRHALLVRGPDGVKVLDDRSLNGVYVNGERVEGRILQDGDEVLVGCHSLRFLELPAAAPEAPAADPQDRQLTA